MPDHVESPAPAKQDPAVPDHRFPTEPFPCPACGQMLGPECRVCVACKEPIDPAAIRRSHALPAELETPTTPSLTERVGFPWRLFLLVFLARLGAALLTQGQLGFAKASVLLGSVELFTSVWVLFDAHRKRIPKPLRWGLGSALLWVLVFPWYLVRRRRPQALCPFVEAEVGPVSRALFLALMVLFLLSLVGLFFKGPPGG